MNCFKNVFTFVKFDDYQLTQIPLMPVNVGQFLRINRFEATEMSCYIRMPKIPWATHVSNDAVL